MSNSIDEAAQGISTIVGALQRMMARQLDSREIALVLSLLGMGESAAMAAFLCGQRERALAFLAAVRTIVEENGVDFDQADESSVLDVFSGDPDALAEKVAAHVMANKHSGATPLRVWVKGTGSMKSK